MNILELIGRHENLFDDDINDHDRHLRDAVEGGSFLVLGGAGTIGQAVTREIFKRNPTKLHVVDLSENNLVELVRDIRSSLGYIKGDFQTFALDIGSLEYDLYIKQNGPFDYVLNLSALKHVRSEKDPYTLMRMLSVNVLNIVKTIQMSRAENAKKFFAVSTDKAANPVNLMGASKRLMEMCLYRESQTQTMSTARFANVAFSDGSLLHGFNQRIMKFQPLSAPLYIKRYFVTSKEAGELCLSSCILGNNREIFFPKMSEKLHLITFADIALRYLEAQGLEPVICQSEDEARERVVELAQVKKWPCYFFESDTTGEKDFEEFFTDNEVLDMDRFANIGVIQNAMEFDTEKLDLIMRQLNQMRKKGLWSRAELVELMVSALPNFDHKETGKFLDGRM